MKKCRPVSRLWRLCGAFQPIADIIINPEWFHGRVTLSGAIPPPPPDESSLVSQEHDHIP
ncbi:hypothetical protein C4J81_03015 [Deltaproteobacteria bacterium Smac51]|nr:hypothetical protein C4J81_03015 [Deltaproteobacteria bacterium Smac51]